ncbi:KGGVGR-motif variant AAA ATPase [Agrobacterium tumefaciens]|uniref:KGGVGR-motif variant AAA ATPase n=1 Tax=Agrobacterium tumefaciens TaxID=358 RepID=UPI0004701809
MYVVTFYSYKGGVGRTMALVNVAAELTRRGRRVLVIDFDLEAPGITSFRQFAGADENIGIIDYVNNYLQSNVAPDASDFITECSLDIEGKALPIWVLPAGMRDDQYGQKLAAIDWQDLYENRSGYLLFEDLKQQIALNAVGFDYVLIDSRTGHTDVGGICTRQLADGVVLMFFPNTQNISGLKTIVEEIRTDSVVRERSKQLIFCPSRVPDLDDEEGILKVMLDDASQKLRYSRPDCTIKHYDSLSLVEEKIFVIDRPKTKLAGQYRNLTKSIVRANLGDRDGALLAVQEIRSLISSKSKGSAGQTVSTDPVRLDEILSKLDSIWEAHQTDGEVCWFIAAAYHDLGRFADELEALNGALAAGYYKAHLARAINLLSQSRGDEALEDLIATIRSPDTTAIELSTAIEALREIDASWAEVVANSPALEELSPEDVGVLSDVLMSDERTVATATRLLEKALENLPRELGVEPALHSDLVLSLIAIGQYEKAMRVIGEPRESVLLRKSTADLFNYAMAEWGATGIVPKDLLQAVIDRDRLGNSERYLQVNYCQCLALSFALIGDRDEALRLLDVAKAKSVAGTVFSCWRYLYATRRTMMEDLEEMRNSFISGAIDPPFIRRNMSSIS